MFVIFVFNHVDKILAGRADQLGNHVHHLLLTCGWQEHFASDELGQDTADGPDVDRARVLFPRENYFGSPIPARCDIIG